MKTKSWADIKSERNIPAGRGSFKSKEIEIHVPVGLRYQTAKLFTDGGYQEVRCERQYINPRKALSQTLGRTMPSSIQSYPFTLPTQEEGDVPDVEHVCDGYALTFSKVAA